MSAPSGPSIHPDAFGLALWSVFTNSVVPEIVERSDGYIEVADATKYFATFSEWPLRQQKAMDFVRGVALDVGCGSGRVSLHLQSAGIDVVAIDNSPIAIRICRRRGVAKTKLLALENLEQLGQTFDTVVMMGNNLGLLGGQTTGKRILEMLHRRTTRHAAIVGELVNPYHWNDAINRRYRAENRQQRRMPGQLRLRIRFRNVATPWFDYLYASPAELRSIVRGTGWRVSELIDDAEIKYIAVLEKI